MFFLGRSTASAKHAAAQSSVTTTEVASTIATTIPASTPPPTQPPPTVPPPTIPPPQTPTEWFAQDLATAASVTDPQAVSAFADFAHTACDTMNSFGQAFAGLKNDPATYDRLVDATAEDVVNSIDRDGVADDQREAFRAAVFYGVKRFCPQWSAAVAQAIPEFS